MGEAGLPGGGGGDPYARGTPVDTTRTHAVHPVSGDGVKFDPDEVLGRS